MRALAHLLNEMRSAGVIVDYAVFGAVAQMRYTEPVATLDADVLLTMPSPDRLDVLHPVYEFCSVRGFRAEGEAIQVGGWPVQFVPVFSVGRAKDFTRILALLESGSVTREEVAHLAERHGLASAWKRFEARFLDE